MSRPEYREQVLSTTALVEIPKIQAVFLNLSFIATEKALLTNLRLNNNYRGREYDDIDTTLQSVECAAAPSI